MSVKLKVENLVRLKKIHLCARGDSISGYHVNVWSEADGISEWLLATADGNDAADLMAAAIEVGVVVIHENAPSSWYSVVKTFDRDTLTIEHVCSDALGVE